MASRRLAAPLLSASLVLGLVACTSDEPESGSEAESGSTTTLDLADVPVDEICTSVGEVYDLYQGLATLRPEYPAIREYIDAEMPGVIESLRAAAELSPEPLAETMTGLADDYQSNLDALATTESAEDYVLILLDPDSGSAARLAELNQFSEAECGFSLFG